MLVGMLKTKTDTEDGFKLRTFVKGEKYDLADTCARRLINSGCAYNAEPEEHEINIDPVTLAAQRAEMKQLLHTDNGKLVEETFNAMFKPRIPTNPATYKTGAL